MQVYDLPRDKATYNYRYFLPYAPEWGSEEFCNKRLAELVDFCGDAKVDAVQFYVNTLPGTYYMPAHNAEEQLHWAEWMKTVVRPALQKIGVSYQLNYQMILGAGPYNLDMRDEYDWGFLVNQEGEETQGCACPLSERFRKIMGKMLNLWAYTEPDIIWIDDDFRMHNHGIVTSQGGCDFYCYCKKHLKEFAEFAGRAYTREELVSEILKPGPPTSARIKWRQFLGQTMTESAAWINQEIQSVSPQTRVALMTSCPDIHSVEGRDWKGLLTSLSGKYTPMTRPMGHLYTGTVVPVKDFAGTYQFMSQSMATLERMFGVEGIEFGPELENTRFTTWCKSVSNSRYVMVLSQLLGTPQITLSLNDLDGSPISQEPATVPLLRDIKPMLESLAQMNLRKWKKTGVVFIDDEDSAAKVPLEANAKMQDLGLVREWESTLLECGIPAYHSSCAEAADSNNVVVLEGYTAWSPSDEELKEILSGSVLLDSDAAFVLQQRGFGDYLGTEIGQRHTFGTVAEKYRENVIEAVSGRIPHRGRKWRFMKCTGATLVSEFIDAKNRYHPGSCIFENKLGGRIAIYGSIGDLSPMGHFGNHMRIHWLHGILRWLSKGSFAVLAELPHHGVCVVRKNDNETLLSLANLGTDKFKDITFDVHTESEIQSIKILDKNGSWVDGEYSLAKTDVKNRYKMTIKHELNVFEWMIALVKM